MLHQEQSPRAGGSGAGDGGLAGDLDSLAADGLEGVVAVGADGPKLGDGRRDVGVGARLQLKAKTSDGSDDRATTADWVQSRPDNRDMDVDSVRVHEIRVSIRLPPDLADQ